MIQRKKKKILWIAIIVVILVLIVGGSIYIINHNSKQENVKEQLDFSSKRLIVTTSEELEETYNAKSANKLYTGEYVIKYETEEETKNAYENFRKNDKIESVKIDVDVDISLHNANTQTIIQDINGSDLESWGIYTMGLNETQDIINNQENMNEVVVAVIDSGFDLSLPILTEQNLNSRIDDRYINVTDSNDSKNIEDKNYIKDENTGTEILMGHGTHVGGTILDGTPNNVKILPIKCEDSEGDMHLSYVYAAIRYAIDQNVDVINMSLGWELSEINRENTDNINTLIQEANEKGITVIAATGNGDENGVRKNGANIYPAAYENVIGVSALNTNIIETTIKEVNGEQTIAINLNSYIQAKNSKLENLNYTSFSNYGTTVDFSAPGQYILSLLPTESAKSSFPILDGTSMASPHIAATVATIKSYNKEFTNNEIYEILQYYAEDLGTEGKDNDYGEGMPCFKNYTECTCDCEECDTIYCFGCPCQTCIYNTQTVKTLESIEITTPPTKTIYTEGEIFNKTGMVVEAVYSDGSREPVTNYTYSPTGELSKTDTKITVTYEEKTAEQEITVNEKVVEPPEPEITLTKIEITTPPTKTIYTEGEIFNKTGMVVEAVYSDGSREPVTNYTYSPTGELSKTDTKITVTYEEKTAEQEITVNEKVVEPPEPEITLTKIEITTSPTKTTYTEGEMFDKAGMVVTAVYSDGSTKNITNYNCFPTTAFTTSHNKVTVTYTENGKTVTVEIPITVQAKNTNTENGEQSGDSTNQGNDNESGSSTNQGNNNGAGNNSGNNNNSNIGNMIQINNGGTTNNNTTDNTTKDGTIAYTGLEDYVIPGIIVVVIIGAITLKKYKQYKDI